MAPDPLTSRVRAAGLWPLLPIAVAVFCMSALVYYHVWEDGSREARSLLQATVISMYEGIGFMPAFLLCALGLVWSSIWFLGGPLAEPRVRIAKITGCVVALAIWINLRGSGEVAGPHTGAFGNAIATRLVDAIGFVPAAVLLAPLTLVLFLLATDFLFYRHFDELWMPRERKAAVGSSEDGGVGHAEAEIFKSLAQAEELEAASREAAVAGAAIRETRSSWRERRRRWRETVEPLAEDVTSAGAATEAAAAGSAAHDASAAQPEVGESHEMPLAPSDDGVGTFAQAEGVIAEEIGTVADTEGVAVENTEGSAEATFVDEPTAVLAETVSEDDVARELVVGEAAEAVVPAEAHAALDEVVPETGATTSAPGGLDDDFAQQSSLDTSAGALVEEPEAMASAEVEEPVVEIPRPSEDAPRQGSLFGLKRGDDPLVAEAIDLIQQSGRASASFLQRKLRVDFGTATQLLLILAERGVIELDADQSQGRLLR